ncbi:MAG: dUTP diphosphatase [Acidobacteria bacterium]|nr:MAG: dUTP diphosphatase [Acidobacteriota bacterium]
MTLEIRVDGPGVLPEYATEGAAGADLRAAEAITLPTGGRAAVATGLFVEIPAGYVGLVWPRSGLAVRHGIDTLAGVIDSDYRGEVKVVLVNHGPEPLAIAAGDRIAQLLPSRPAGAARPGSGPPGPDPARARTQDTGGGSERFVPAVLLRWSCVLMRPSRMRATRRSWPASMMSRVRSPPAQSNPAMTSRRVPSPISVTRAAVPSMTSPVTTSPSSITMIRPARTLKRRAMYRSVM